MPERSVPVSMNNAGRHRFLTTRWSLVLTAAEQDSAASRAALATLCELYWYPVYAFVRRMGHGSDQARDLTQAFFTRLLENEFLRKARPERGRFRSYVLASVRHFLSNQHEHRRALKRGEGRLWFRWSSKTASGATNSSRRMG
jgi:RNA polymerase sigma-70 factor (ECF subfamily)